MKNEMILVRKRETEMSTTAKGPLFLVRGSIGKVDENKRNMA